MVLVLISKKICTLGCILLLYVACLQASTPDDLPKEHREAIEKFNELVKWPLSPIGKFASDIVEIVMTNSSKAINETLKRGGKSQMNFISHAMIQTLANQLGITLCVVIGILICLLMLFLPCCLGLYSTRQNIALENSASKRRIDSKSQGFLLFEIFIICIAVAILGAVFIIIGSLRFYFTLVVPFGFANFTVQSAFQLKVKLLVSHQSRLNDVSRSAFDVIMLLNNVNEDVSSDFMRRLQNTLQPTLSIASSAKWELIKVMQLLKTQGTLFNKFIHETGIHTNTHVDRFISSVKSLQKALGKDSAMLDPLVNISKLSISNESAAGYFAPIPTLENVSKINIQAGPQEMSTKLKQIVIQKQYDPSDLIDKLKHSAFKVQKNLAESTTKYVDYINANVKNQDLNPLLEKIGKAEREAHEVAFIFNLVILVLAVASLVLAIALVLAFHCGVYGTFCFLVVKENNRKIFKRSKTSHRSGGALLFLCYVISVFLWIFWLGCVLLFFLTSLPLTGCRAMNDYSILDVTFDSSKLRSTPGWYSLFSSNAFNMTLKQTVIRCKEDDTFVPTLPDPLVDTSYGTQIKSTLNISDVVANFSKDAISLSSQKFTGYDITQFKLANLLKDIDISPPFGTLQSFLINLKGKNVTETMSKIKKQARGKTVASLADTVQRAYNSMVANVSTALANNKTFVSTINSADLTVKAAEKHVAYLNWTADELYPSVIKDSVGLFDTALNVTLNKLIDTVFIEMQLAALAYRKSMSLCPAITLFYEKAAAIFCNVLLHPVACCWFGFFLLAVFLLIAIVISMRSVRFFRFLPDVFQEDRGVPGAVRAEDIPTSPTPSIHSARFKEDEDEEDFYGKSSEKSEPEDSAPEDESSAKPPKKQKSHDQKSSEEKSPEQESSKQNSPDQKSSKQNSPDQKSSKQNSPDQKSSKKTD